MGFFPRLCQHGDKRLCPSLSPRIAASRVGNAGFCNQTLKCGGHREDGGMLEGVRLLLALLRCRCFSRGNSCIQMCPGEDGSTRAG